MSNKFIDIDKVFKSKNPGLYRWLPRFVLGYVKRILHQEEINQFMVDHKDDGPFEFCRSVTKHFEVKTEVTGLENIPKTGGCILAANHPLGGFDALTLLPHLESVRTDICFIVNDLLLNFHQLNGIFTGVNKHGRNATESLQNVDALFASDKAVFVFPAGLVSRRTKGVISDLEWKKTFITRAKRYNKPIIPIHVDGRLSNFFYNLSNTRKKIGMKANLEMFYLSNEMFKQHGHTIRFTIGKPILPETFAGKGNDQHWANVVKKEVYKMGAEAAKKRSS